MKNLKKVLALVMAFTIAFTVMAGAAFTDQSDIVTTDAVNLLTTLGVIEGNPDGSFAPEKTVTRAEMAKMIFVIRNNKVDDAAYANNSTKFTDINGHWAAGYIKFCESQGIIAGKTATLFDPDADVTGVEAGKMMLVLTGYDPAKAGLTGPSWSTNTLRYAGECGLLDDVDSPLESGLPRQYAAQMLSNCLDADRVKWSNDAETFDYFVTTGGYRETVGEKYMELTTAIGVLTELSRDSLSITQSSSDIADSNNGLTSFTNVKQDYSALMGQKVKVLVRDRKSNQVIGIYAADDNEIHAVAANAVEKDDNKIKFGGKSYSVELFGTDANNTVSATANGNALRTYVDGAIANGLTLNELDTMAQSPNMLTFVDTDANGKLDTLIVKTNKVAKVTFASSSKIIAGGVTYNYDDEIIDEDLAKDDWVVISENPFMDCKNINKADVTTGTLKGLKDAETYKPVINGSTKAEIKYNKYMVDDEWYNAANESALDLAGNTIKGQDVDLKTVKTNDKVEAVIVNGITFSIKRSTGTNTGRVSDAAMIVNVSSTGLNDQVKLAFFDGTTKTVTVDNDSKKNGGYVFNDLKAGTVYEYSVSDDEYTFYALKAGAGQLAATGDDKKYDAYYGDMTYIGSKGDGTQALGGSGYYTTYNGKTISDDAQILLFQPGNQTTVTNTGNDSKMISGKQFKSMSRDNILTEDTKAGGFKVYGFVGDMSGLNQVGAIAVPVKDAESATTSYNNYGYIVSKAYKSGTSNNAITYTIWNGTENVVVTESGTTNVNAKKKGAVIGYDSIDENGMIHDVAVMSDTTTPKQIVLTAIDGVKDNNGTVTLAYAAQNGKSSLDITSSSHVLFVDSQNSNSDNIGVESASIKTAVKKDGKYLANALVIADGDDVELLIVEIGDELKSDVYTYAGATTPPTPGPGPDGDAKDGVTISDIEVNKSGKIVSTVAVERQTWMADNTAVTVKFDIYVDGVYDDNGTATVTGSSVRFTSALSHYEANDSIELRITSAVPDAVKVSYVNGDDNSDLTSRLADGYTKTLATGSSAAIGFTIKTSDSNKTLKYTLSGTDNDVTTQTALSANNDAAQSLTGKTAKGDKGVVVTVYGLKDIKETYSITTTDVTTVALGDFDVTGTDDASETLTIDAVTTTGIVQGRPVALTAELSAKPKNAYGYEVTVTVDGKKYSAVLTDNTATNLTPLLTVNSDIEIKKADVSVKTIERVAVAGTAADAKVTVTSDVIYTIEFNQDIALADNVDKTNFDGDGGQMCLSATVEGNKLVLTMDTAIGDGEAINFDRNDIVSAADKANKLYHASDDNVALTYTEGTGIWALSFS